MSVVKVAVITTEERETHSRHELPDPWFGVAPSALLDGFKRCPDVEVHVLTCVRRPVRMPERIADNIFCHSVLIPHWGFLRTGYLPCVLAIRRVLRRIQPKVVHGQGTERYAALAAAFSGFLNVVTLHGNMAELARIMKARPGSFLWLTARLENIALKRTGGVFCNSRYTRTVTSPRTAKTWLVPNAVTESFLASPPTAQRRPRCLLLHVGLISENKQQVQMLQMARSLWEQKLDFELQFIGAMDQTAPYARVFLEQVKQTTREGFASYLGPKSTAELLQYFDSASALVHTPISESFGLVVAEALARDLKVFGFRVGGLLDIAEGTAGTVLLEPNDWTSLAKALADWLLNGKPAPSSNANLMRARYSQLTVARRHVEIYREVLNRTASSR